MIFKKSVYFVWKGKLSNAFVLDLDSNVDNLTPKHSELTHVYILQTCSKLSQKLQSESKALCWK